jgi:hypothetical protein
VPFGLSLQEGSASEHQLPEVSQPIRLVPFTSSNAKQKLQKAIEAQRSKNKFVVVVDCTPSGEEQQGGTASTKDRVSVYNELQVPFVLESKGGAAHQEVVRDTEESKTLALIAEQMNKRMSVMDQMFSDWSRRYPGLFDDFDFSFRSTRPRETPRSLLDSFSDLINREFDVENIMSFGERNQRQQLQNSTEQQQPQPQRSAEVPQPPQQQQQMQQEKQKPTLEAHLAREYTFKNGSGSSTYSFTQSVDDTQEFAESVADSVGFLAQKFQELARPQVYSILDVAAQPTKYLSII